jgi:hypothetical protein
MNCYYCEQPIRPKPTNRNVLSGFRDNDNGKIVCFSKHCKSIHYFHKNHSEHAHLVGETPIPTPASMTPRNIHEANS